MKFSIVNVFLTNVVTYHFNIIPVQPATKSVSYSEFSIDVKESTFVDKTMFIKDVLQDQGHKIVITAPRGFGKSTNLQMLKAFLQLEVDKHGNTMTSMKDRTEPIKDTPNFKLFQQLKIVDHQDMMEKHFGKYPVIYVDLRTVVRFSNFNETQDFFKDVLHETVSEHYYLQNSEKLFDDEREFVKLWASEKYREEDMGTFMPGLARLSKYLFKHFDRTRVVILVDHYDSPVYNCVYDPDVPKEAFNNAINVIQALFSIQKDDFYVDTFLLTGISQIEEPHVSNGNIIKRYEFLNEHRFVPYFGLVEDDVFDILGRYTVEVDNDIFESVQHHYGGYQSLNNRTMHNTWAILKYLEKQKLDHMWAKGSDIRHLKALLNIPDIHQKLERMLKGLPVVMELKKTFSAENLKILRDLLQDPFGKEHLWYTTLFYSFLFEQGFLSYDPTVISTISDARRYVIPNEEVKTFLWETLDE